MKTIGQALSLVAILAGSASAAEPEPRWRAVLGNIEASIPSKPIKSVSIVPVDGAPGGDVVIDFTDGTSHRLYAQGYAQAVQMAPGGQSFGFTMIECYIDTKGDLWTASREIVLYRRGKRASFVIPERQATVGWAFRDTGKSIAVSTQGTHGLTGLGLYDVSTRKRLATVEGGTMKPDQSGCRVRNCSVVAH